MSATFSERDMSLEFCYTKKGDSTSMEKSIYDADADGVVDNAARLGGYPPSHFALAADLRGLRVVNVTLDADGGLDFEMEDGTHFVTDSVRGADGMDGIDGKNGEDGYTPVKGIDYFTEEDVAEIVARVLAALPEGGTGGEGGGETDSDVVATLTEEALANGTNGAFLEIGEAYYANDTYFVAVAQGGDGYPAPRHGTIIKTEGNSGTVNCDGSAWCVSWENGPSDTRTVVFRRTEKAEVEPVADVEATVDSGVLTMRSGLPWVRWYNIHIWANGKDTADAPSIAVQSDTFAETDHNQSNAVSIPLRSIFLQNDVALPEDGSTVHLRIEADDEMQYPVIELDAVWSTPAQGDVVATLTEEALANGTTGDFLEVGRGYYANDTYFVAVRGTGADCPTPPDGTVIETEGNRGTVSFEGSGWCVSWENGPISTRSVIFRKAEVSA